MWIVITFTSISSFLLEMQWEKGKDREKHLVLMGPLTTGLKVWELYGDILEPGSKN